MNYKDTIWHKVITYGLEMIGRYYGCYRAIVFDNNDPLKMNRLRLIIPNLDPNSIDPNWAFPKGMWGGKGYGQQLLPQKGDVVWIEFEYGDSDYPIWSFSGYAEEEKPEEFETIKHYGFKTPRGSIIVINDNKDEEEILVKHKNKLEWIKITLEEVELEAKLIKLGKNGDEQATMGDTLKEKLDDVMGQLDELNQALITHIHTTPVGPSGPPINANVITQIKSDMITTKFEFPEFLSEKVKIDK